MGIQSQMQGKVQLCLPASPTRHSGKDKTENMCHAKETANIEDGGLR